MTLPTVAMDALMTITALTYDDLAEIADILTRLFSAEGQVLDLNQQLGAAQSEVAALSGWIAHLNHCRDHAQNPAVQGCPPCLTRQTWALAAARAPLRYSQRWL